jgi:hypothetical protein
VALLDPILPRVPPVPPHNSTIICAQPKPSQHSTQRKYEEEPYQAQLSILSINVRGLTPQKLQAINTYIKSNNEKYNNVQIVVVHELKASIATPTAYIKDMGWNLFPLYRSNKNPNIANAGLALLINDKSHITAEPPEFLPPHIHTINELGIATWNLTHPNWTSPILLTACYWPTGPVPTYHLNSSQDHIEAF